MTLKIIKYFNLYSRVDQLSGDPLDRFSRFSRRSVKNRKNKAGREMWRIIVPLDNKGEPVIWKGESKK